MYTVNILIPVLRIVTPCLVQIVIDITLDIQNIAVVKYNWLNNFQSVVYK